MKRRTFLSVVVPLAAAASLFAEKKPVDDGQITDRVRQRLFSDPEIKGYTIEVDVKNGVVTLTGTAGSERARTKAEKLTRKVAGVKSVVNKLRVETPRPK
jgi:osmotically-inducible protein OsmY